LPGALADVMGIETSDDFGDISMGHLYHGYVTNNQRVYNSYMGMDQYLLIAFLVG